ncbi:MAG TPA: MerR family DNA-binding transcriptional regulator [Rhodobacterales bacterium]|nr:MerR family DNA-binding transcriptional regulator [Rhodobacterales bacterium]
MANERLSFKDMCARFDVTPRTLRYYEYIELLSPERVGRTRLFTPRDIARMTLIKRGRRFGFSLEELRQWLQMRDEVGKEAQMRTLVEAAERQLAKLDDQIATLQRARDDLDALRTEVAESLG